jgi:hypothetical protein
MCHVWGRGEVLTEFWWGNLKARGHLEDLGIDARVKLKWKLKKCDEGENCHRIWTMAGCFEHDKKACGCVECGELLE